MASKLQTFRLQFLDTPTAGADAAFGEMEIAAAHIDAATWEAERVRWPRGVRACRLSSRDRSEVAYRLRAGADGIPAMIVKFA